MTKTDDLIPPAETMSFVLLQCDRARAITRLEQAQRESWVLLNAMEQVVQQYPELGATELIQQLTPLNTQYHEVCGEIKGLKLALGQP